ncbi:hypothetical protein [Candidatus Nitrosocosmicus hydrocola]|jgi:hypothetical protein|uniref:hypothetical protein n=1 Tax=Candidatus Nitrosocosmicus hydrocola TaxID=1826872 RepID=UPI0011E60356|nr:hypothetical protein [Candidatus Nitrosocosmicus hydrocola]
MSEFAFIRFLSLSLLTEEEKSNKNEILEFTEQVLDAEGIECDSKISKVSEEKLKEILEQVRKLRKKKRKNTDEYENAITVEEVKE